MRYKSSYIGLLPRHGQADYLRVLELIDLIPRRSSVGSMVSKNSFQPWNAISRLFRAT
jgi:hypothetical protein